MDGVITTGRLKRSKMPDVLRRFWGGSPDGSPTVRKANTGSSSLATRKRGLPLAATTFSRDPAATLLAKFSALLASDGSLSPSVSAPPRQIREEEPVLVEHGAFGSTLHVCARLGLTEISPLHCATSADVEPRLHFKAAPLQTTDLPA